MNKIRILFLAANPATTIQLRLDEEIRAITEKIRATKHRDSLELVSAWAVRPDDLLQSLNEYEPHIVHFSGHGSTSGEIILVDSTGTPKAVDAEAIKTLFTVLKDNIRVVVLNACFSRLQAQAVTEVIDCAVGMNTAVGDRAAIIFAASFYRALGFGRSVQQAFEQGKTALILEGISEENTPELSVKTGVIPSELFLIQGSDTESNVDETVGLAPSDVSTWPFVDTDSAALRIIQKGREELVPLDRLRMIVGRSSIADINLVLERCASRIHFAIIWNPESRSHYVEDMGHINPIFLNGARVPSHSRQELKVGDEIRLGTTIMRYERR